MQSRPWNSNYEYVGKRISDIHEYKLYRKEGILILQDPISVSLSTKKCCDIPVISFLYAVKGKAVPLPA
jgi:hypothetical protein